MIPIILEMGLLVAVGLDFEVTFASMAPGLLPIIAWSIYDKFSSGLYPYDYLTDLNHAQLRNELPLIHPNPRLQEQIAVHLSGRDHVMLMRPAGSGKTTVIQSLAQWIETPQCPARLKNKRIYHLDIDSLLSNPSKAIERILPLLQELNAVLQPL